MTAFTSRWLDWQPSNSTEGRENGGNGGVRGTASTTPETLIQRTDKTDKSPSVSFVSSSPRRIRPEMALDVEHGHDDDKPHELDHPRGGISSSGWDVETAALIAWFRESTPPSEPFVMRRDQMGHPFVTVLNPARYWQAVGADIEVGPSGPRARYGALQGDLSRLRRLFGHAAGP